MCCACGGGSARSIAVPTYNSASYDFEGKAMRGVPFASSLQKFSFCVAPGDYTMHAIDTHGDGWWGGARYYVYRNGAVIVYEEMGTRSSSWQSTRISVALQPSARTTLSNNRALQGGGGAIFWEHEPPGNIKRYRNESSSNKALYGNYVATPARTLLATNSSYRAVSGDSMTANPIVLELKDR